MRRRDDANRDGEEIGIVTAVRAHWNFTSIIENESHVELITVVKARAKRRGSDQMDRLCRAIFCALHGHPDATQAC
jgi:hypothetical protein